MRPIRAAAGYSIRTGRHFVTRVLGSPALMAFLAAAFAGQVVVGQSVFGLGAPLALLSAFGSFMAFSLVGVLIVFFTRDGAPPPPESRLPALQLLLVGAVVALHLILLLGIFPHPEIAENPVTAVFHRPFGGTIRAVKSLLVSFDLYRAAATAIAICVAQVTFLVILPLVLLLPLSRRAEDYGLRGFDVRLWLVLSAFYVPAFVHSLDRYESLLAGSLVYFFMAALPEEFLYRALLQARLERVCRDGLTAVVIASLVFGLMHLPINSQAYGWPTGLAFCLGQNAFGGFLAGYLFLRTRSLPLVVLLHFWAGVATAAAA